MPKLRLLTVALALYFIAGVLAPIQAADPPVAPADGSVLPFPPVPSASIAGPTLQESKHQRRAGTQTSAGRCAQYPHRPD